jgi:PAS domain S-box-containing protein
MVGRNCRLLQGVDTDVDTARVLHEAVASRRTVAVEILNYARDGMPFWNAINSSPIYDRNGGLIYFAALQVDVTRRRETEQALPRVEKLEALGQLTAGLA